VARTPNAATTIVVETALGQHDQVKLNGRARITGPGTRATCTAASTLARRRSSMAGRKASPGRLGDVPLARRVSLDLPAESSERGSLSRATSCEG